MRKYGMRCIPLVLFALLALFLWRGLSLDPHHLPSARLDQPLPSFRVPLLASPGSFFTEKSLKGQVSLLNVWASWCAACIDEQVFLMQLARDGVPIFGLGYKDKASRAIEWLSSWGNPYRMVGEDYDGKVAIDLGVYGAPETFLVDKVGVIRYRHAGAMTEAVWHKEFLPRMKQWESHA